MQTLEILALIGAEKSDKNLYRRELEMCPQYTDVPAVGYLTIKILPGTNALT